MKFFRIKCVQLFLLIVATFLSTQVAAFELAFQAGINYGGENSIDSLKDINGNGHPLPAGAGTSYSIGMEYPLSEDSYIRALVGFVNNSIKGRELNSNSRFEFEWTHIPIDVLYYKQNRKTGNLNYGGGLSLQLNPKVVGSGFLAGQNESYKPALGVLFEIDYPFTQKFYLGIKYTVIDYKSNTRGSIKGNSIGLAIGYSFTL